MAGEPDETTSERELTRRLRRRGVSTRCPACDWHLDGPLGDYRLLPAGALDELDIGPAGVMLRIYACRNCGYIRLHSASVLQDIQEGGGP